jgi:hypothetical protein
MRWTTTGAVGASMTGLLMSAGVASAQDPPPSPAASTVPSAPTAPPAAAAPSAPSTPAPPPPAAVPRPPPPVTIASESDTPPEKPEEPKSDHARFVGHFGVGYFGISALPFPGAGNTGAVAIQSVQAPVIGIRYWASEMLGVDLGIGFATNSASTTSTVNGTSMSTDQPGSLGFAFHAGMPIAVAGGKHYSFQIVPEANIGFTSGTIKGTPATTTGGVSTPDTDLSGFLISVGAHVGAEIHFGFIGIPELALQANVGLYVTHQSVKESADGTSDSYGQTTFTTSVGSNPWSIFADNVAALYYF